jgi:hypothetical protein
MAILIGFSTTSPSVDEPTAELNLLTHLAQPDSGLHLLRSASNCADGFVGHRITVVAGLEPAATVPIDGCPSECWQGAARRWWQIEYIPGKVAGGCALHVLAGHDPRVGQLFQRGARGGGRHRQHPLDGPCGDQRCFREELDEPRDGRVSPRDLPDALGVSPGGKLFAPPCSQLRDLGSEVNHLVDGQFGGVEECPQPCFQTGAGIS